MKTIIILDSAKEIINAFNPSREIQDKSAWIGNGGVLTLVPSNNPRNPYLGLRGVEGVAIRDVFWEDLLKEMAKELHIKIEEIP